MGAETKSGSSNLVSAVISCILSLVIFATMRFYSGWLTATQMNTIVGGFVGSWLFVFALTAVSNVEMLVFGNDFQAKFIPEILTCLTLATVASGVVHRVCATTCIVFCIAALYFVNRISNKYHNRGTSAVEQAPVRRGGGKKNK
ncbi:protein KRTCAP2 homolog [Anastrepha obliqua]|uniref:protein KRTCAP2 homolog n=1 Tax=Anastrepha ludens TaxID=28586 RepID=UPI0023AF1DA5|nr:protein KRTCAP2 homolog [Anastrepha ludens]XP_054745351.1 protein KRTCAP2 homolog [Anastrepha obliqua]